MVLNRFVASHILTEERVADLVGIAVELTIPNSFALANASAERGSAVDPSTPLGKSYTKLAQIPLNNRIEFPRKQKKFLEFLYQPFVRPQTTG